MNRRVACFAAFLSLPAFGCEHAVQPGLSNAPALGGPSAVDPRVHDAIANGPDSCERHLDSSPLRNRFPPCGTDASPATTEPAATGGAVRAPGIAFSWLDHLHARWAWDSTAGDTQVDAYEARPPTAIVVDACALRKATKIPSGP